MLSKYIYGGYEDNISGIVAGQLYKIFGWDFVKLINYPFGYTFDLKHTNQPIFWNIYHFFNFRFDSVVVSNVFIILTLVLILICSYLFFRHFFMDSLVVPFLLSLVFTFSPYHYYQLRTHIDLSQTWVLPLFLLLRFRAKNWKHFLGLGLLLGVIVGVSNYLAFMLLLYLVVEFLVLAVLHIKAVDQLKNLFKQYSGMTLGFVFSAGIVLAPFLLFMRSQPSTDVFIPDRSMEEFFYFTSRPWYYVLPSVDNPFFGRVSVGVLDFLQNDWGYFLTQNYIKEEHSATFLGWSVLGLALVGVWRLMKDKNRPLLVLTIVCAGLLLLTFPPYFTLAGFKIYTSSYLLGLLFPMFRVLSRLGVLILLIELVIAGYGLIYLKKKSPLFSVIILFSLAEFFVPLKFTDVSRPPKVFEYIRDNTDSDAVVAVFPYSKTRLTYLWMPVFQRAYVNNRDVVIPAAGFDSNMFTMTLDTNDSLTVAKILGTTHLVIFSKDISADVAKFFAENYKLEHVIEDVTTGAVLYKLK